MLSPDDRALVADAIAERKRIYHQIAELRREFKELTNSSLADKFDVPTGEIMSVQKTMDNEIYNPRRNKAA